MDLDDVLEDLWEDAARGARDRVREARHELDRRRRMPGFRRRVRNAMLYGSAGWVATFGSLGIGAELATTEPWGTALAVLFGGIALPALGTGLWAWRGRRKDAVLEREAVAKRRAKQERTELPADVVDEWVRLRQAQALVVDLADEGLVADRAVDETSETVEQLRVLLVADRRASGLGATPSVPLRTQVGETADLLVALAVEAVHLRTDEVGRSAGQATLLDARDRLVVLRAARDEVAAAEHGADASAAAAWIEREAARSDPPSTTARPGGAAPDGRDDERGGPGGDRAPEPPERRQQPG